MTSSMALAADLSLTPALPIYTPPPEPSLYLTIGAGYDLLYGPRTHAIESDTPTPRSVDFPKGRDGWFTNAAIGWRSNNPDGLIGQAELYGRITANEGVLNRSGQNDYGLVFATALSDSASAAVTGRPHLQQDHQLVELGLRLKSGSVVEGSGLVVSLEPFLANFSQSTSAVVTDATAFARRDAEIDAWAGGANLALEAAFPLHETAYAVLRASAGVYGMAASGDYSYASAGATGSGNPPVAGYADSRSGIGGRFGGEIRLVQQISTGVSLAAVAGLDYWTRLPTAELTRTISTGPRIGTGFDDFLLVNAGLELTFDLGS